VSGRPPGGVALPRPARDGGPLAWLAILVALPLVLGCGPRRVDVIMSEGIAAHEAGSHDEARARYQAALRLDPKVMGASNNLAALALIADELDDATERLKDELRSHPELAVAQLNQAVTALRARDPAAAERAALDLAELSGGLPPRGADALAARRAARALVACARLARGDAFDAIRAAWPVEPEAGADAWDPARELAHLAIAFGAVAADRLDEAARWLEGLEGPDARRLRAAVALRRGDEGPIRALATHHRPVEATALDLLLDAWTAWLSDDPAATGDALDALGESEVDAFEPALRVSRWRLAAALASREGDWPSALVHLDRALELDRRAADLWLDRALALAHLGRLDDARIVVLGVLRDEPEHPRARELRGLLD